MSWTSVSNSVATWGAVGSVAKTWTTQTRNPYPPAWAPLDPISSNTDQGVDFTLVLSEIGPFLLTEDRPVILMDGTETLP